MRSMIPDAPQQLSREPAAPDGDSMENSPEHGDVTRERSSRRSFVFFGALAAAVLFPKRAHAQARRRGKRPIATEPAQPGGEVIPNESVAAFAEWESPTTRLVRRITLGITPAELQRATTMGYQGYLNYQLNYTRIDDSAVEAAIATRYPLMSQTSDVLFSADAGQVQNQLKESTIYRAAYSQRQLYMRMVEFWTDHFSQSIDK